MKCKQTRQKEKERSKLISEFVSQLKELNPKRYFFVGGNEIHVDTYDLWKIKFPNDWKITLGKDQQEVKSFGYMVLKKENVSVYIYGW